jgi:hypothetical protein
MLITLTGKLSPTPEQHQILLETIKTINAASNWLSPIVREKRTVNKIALQIACPICRSGHSPCLQRLQSLA